MSLKPLRSSVKLLKSSLPGRLAMVDAGVFIPGSGNGSRMRKAGGESDASGISRSLHQGFTDRSKGSEDSKLPIILNTGLICAVYVEWWNLKDTQCEKS